MVHRLFTLLLLPALASGCARSPGSWSAPAPPICDTAPESAECSVAREGLALSQSPPGVTRRGAVLEFSFQNGDSLRLEDSVPEASPNDVAFYHYHAYLASQHAHIVHVHYYEGDSFLLLAALTGRTRDLAGPPLPSPDQARFLSYSVTGGYSGAELQVWRVARELPDLELRVQPSSWEPRGAYWATPTRIEVPPHRSPGTTESWETTVHLELSEGAWVIGSEARCRLTSGCS